MGRTSFYLEVVDNGERRRRDEKMIEDRARGLDQEVLGMFKSSYLKRYEQWKRGGLLLIAIKTMPKQVKTEKVIDNLLKLKSEYSKRLSDET
ncbi:MAG TPA: hypothetical protein VJ529_00945 [Candidatus Bathyarchaeia archaeon]|nr:hypothetical protein [Candidatus Bathyarchaeia archaeon]